MASINLASSISTSGQYPLDSKVRFKTLSEMSSGILVNSFKYYEDMICQCIETHKQYIWRERIASDPANDGVLAQDFTYPNGAVANGITYSNRKFNFFDYNVKGEKGDKGDTGLQGIQGIQGVKGDRGDKGDKGDKGLRGIHGNDGVNGKSAYQIFKEQNPSSVLTEIQWINSLKGAKGDKGDKGDRGLQGERGLQGTQGIQGIKGDKGDKGDRGLQGERGLQGVKGDKGDKGDPAPTISQLQASTNITTSALINTHSQNGKHVMMLNGTNNLTVTINSSDKFCATYQKTGAGNITFVAGTGKTLVQVDSTNVISGAIGSSATVSIVGNTAYVRIANA